PTEQREFRPRMDHESLLPRIRCGDPNRAMGTLTLSSVCQQPLWELHLELARHGFDMRLERRIAVSHDLSMVAGQRAASQRRNQIEDGIRRGDVPVIDRQRLARGWLREGPAPGAHQVTD